MREETVTTSQDNGARNQWATGIFYRKDGTKWTLKSKSLLGFLSGLFLFCLIAMLFGDNGVTEEAHVDPIPASDITGDTHKYSFKKLDIASEPEMKTTTTTSPRRASPPEKYVGLARLDRIDALRIPPGVLSKANLSSGASNGPVRATLTESVQVDGDELLPSGAMLIGTGSSTEDRLFIRFTQAVFSDGKTVKITAQACDGSDQTVGLKGSKAGGEALKLAAGIGLNFAGGLSEGLQESEVQGGVEVKKPTAKNALLNGASKASLEYARQSMSELRSQQPVIEVPNGTEICVLFQGGEDG